VEEPAKSSVVEDDFFGPTTWERIESAELEALPEDPLVFESELSAAPRFEPTIEPPEAPRVQAPEPGSPINRPATQLPAAPVESPRPPAERHYVATGFLGLDETVEDEEDIAREKRPWWKKMFLD
jgi:hypothetical protein